MKVALKEVEEEAGIKNVRAVSEDIFSLEILTVDAHIRRGEYVPSHLHLNVTYLLEADDNEAVHIKEDENTGTITRQHLGFLTAAANANFNTLASEVSSLVYFLDHEYKVVESDDPRFIPGRQAALMVNGKQAGVFGELHPQVLENWGITTPCVAGELDLEDLI